MYVGSDAVAHLLKLLDLGGLESEDSMRNHDGPQ